MKDNRGISSFSVLLMTAVAVIAGLASISLLKIQFSPSAPTRSITVSFSMPGASAQTVENEATSLLEGALSRISSVKGTSSVSSGERGQVTVSFDRKCDIAQARLEVATAVRNIYEALPSGVTYPAISLSSSGEKPRTAISFTIKGDLPPVELEHFAEDRLCTELAPLPGVDRISVSGGTPREWVITFHSARCEALGITAQDISKAVSTHLKVQDIGRTDWDGKALNVRLRSEEDFDDIPIKRVGNRLILLRDIAQCTYREAQPDHYFRVNGLNTVSLSATVASDASLLQSVRAIKKKMRSLESIFPATVSAAVSYDSTEYISGELQKILKRTGLCLLILLLLVAVISRSARYTGIMALTLFTTLSIAVALYALTGLRIHIYTLAGITVSLGIIIDCAIVMVDHYSRWHNRSAFPALVSAVLTTVAALLVIFLLPEKDRVVLTDFIWVIVINLGVSLLVAYFFVPALLDKVPLKQEFRSAPGIRRLRCLARWDFFYASFIRKAVFRKWVAILLLVIAFGIPTCLLPQPKTHLRNPTPGQERYTRFMTESFYGKNRKTLDKILGTSFAAFHKSLGRSNFYREPAERILWIHASLPEGRTVGQLNDIVRSMENYLARFDGISVYTTTISSSTSADIEVRFKPEVRETSFPDQLKSEVTAMAINFGGANWRISGVNDSYFNNNVAALSRRPHVLLKGYNYDDLLAYSDTAMSILERNPRVSFPVVQDGRNDDPKTEYSLNYDFETMTRLGVNPYRYFNDLRSPLYGSQIATVLHEGRSTPVVLCSDARDSLDLWHIVHTGRATDEQNVKLSTVGSIVKKQTGFPIRKSNQSYTLGISYDFIGSAQLEKKTVNDLVDHLNDNVLPVGYKASSPTYGRSDKEQDSYIWLILLVIAVIYVLCAMCFESLRQPFAVILLIPVSFIGLFLVFGLTDFPFDQGGFAAMVMLCGITVNAGIYLVYQYKDLLPACLGGKDAFRLTPLTIRIWLKAFRRKIVPILLTILSTVMGLVPFLFDGPKEVFWFDFAVGTMAGTTFSLIAILFYLPTFLFRKPR